MKNIVVISRSVPKPAQHMVVRAAEARGLVVGYVTSKGSYALRNEDPRGRYHGPAWDNVVHFIGLPDELPEELMGRLTAEHPIEFSKDYILGYLPRNTTLRSVLALWCR